MSDTKQNSVTIKRILELLPDAELRGNAPETLSTVAIDSRKVTPDGIFVAIIGYETDGHLFLEKAAALNAALLVVERDHITANPDIVKPVENYPLLVVENTRLAASVLASEFYGNPSEEISVHGITGTKGKTTTANMLGGIFKAANRAPAVMGTLGISYGDKHWMSALTTPGPIEYQANLRMLRDLGATDICTEVSAHAGALSRTASVHFASVAYLNLSRDHGDHFSEEEYLEAKLAISRDAVKVNPEVIGVGNIRDPHTEAFLQPIDPGRRILFGAYEENEETGQDADVTVRIKSRSSHNLHLEVHTETWNREIDLPLIGRFNAQNSAAAISIAIAAGISADEIVEGLTNAKPVPGRLERIDLGQDFLAVVDYAHAPQPAEEALNCLREITPGRLIGVMGAGGSRDRGKRPMIGEVLARDCDVAIITSDNPRKEEPLDIINDIKVGVTRIADNRAETVIEVDRKAAIETAMSMARTGDTVAILGKGHETYQIFMDETIDFDDREVVRDWLINNGYGGTE